MDTVALGKNKNVIVTRTFSKIYGLASLRLGWCYAHSNIISSMNKVRGPFNVNHLASGLMTTHSHGQSLVQLLYDNGLTFEGL